MGKQVLARRAPSLSLSYRNSTCVWNLVPRSEEVESKSPHPKGLRGTDMDRYRAKHR